PWIYLFFNRNLVHALKYQVCRCQDRNANSVSCAASSCQSTGTVPELTTQGTDVPNNLSRQGSPTESTLRKATVTITTRNKLLEPQRFLAEKNNGRDSIEMMSVVCKSTDTAPWNEKIVFVRKTGSYQDLICP
ncbi:unnamed protein product, partial [Ixodes hexagonus]